MIVQFILRLVFFYCLFVLIRSLFRSFIVNQNAKQSSNSNYNSRKTNNDPNVFDAEYTVIDKDKNL